jgi:glycine/D-amino acid oxidase-like deaminating enzyme
VIEIVVVGSGITGASIAYHAARLGATVTIVDKALPAAGATGESFGWIGASERVPGPGGALHAIATREYRRLAAELPAVRVCWRGSLQWGGRHPLDDLEPGRHLVRAEQIAALEPNLRTPPPWAVHIPGDGAVDPPVTTDALVAAACDRGARLVACTAVTGLRVVQGRVVGVDTTSGFLESGAVVLANGPEVPVLCAPLGVAVPLAPSPAILLRLAGPPDLLRTIVATPDMDVRAGDGELISAVEYAGETSAAELARSAERVRHRISELFRGGEDVRVLSARVGMRPMPTDGHPLIGPLPTLHGAYVAVMHPGVTLAAVAGRLVAEELVHGVEAPELQGCRPR